MHLSGLTRSVVLALVIATPIHAGEVRVAVAANFTSAAEDLAAAFTARTGDDVILSFGATGALYAQITQGAPFDAFLSADAALPRRAVDEGYGVPGSVFTYAVGRLVLYSASLDVRDGVEVLAAGDFQHIAIADPATAPYGAAAMEVLGTLGLLDALGPSIVTGENVTQALQFIATGNAELGFVALSQVADEPDTQVWVVPADAHEPIRQDAVLLSAGAENPVAAAFLAYLTGTEARAIIARAGYEVE